MTEYLLVIPIEPMDVGSCTPAGAQLPLHCTLMPWFIPHPDLSLSDLKAEIGKIAAQPQFSGVELISEKPELFGPNKDIPVHVLKKKLPLHALHEALLALLEEMNSLPNDHKWVGPGYRPHVTDTSRNYFPPGSRLGSRNHMFLCLIQRREDGSKETVAVFPVG